MLMTNYVVRMPSSWISLRCCFTRLVNFKKLPEFNYFGIMCDDYIHPGVSGPLSILPDILTALKGCTN